MRRPALLAATAAALAGLFLLIAGCGTTTNSTKPGPISGWGKNGVVKLNDFEIEQTLEDSSGRVLVVGLYNDRFAQVVRLRPDGSLDPSFGRGGIVRWPYRMFVKRYPFGRHFLGWNMAAFLPGGKVALAGTNNFGDIDEQSTLIVSELDESGRIARGFGQNGYFITELASCLRGPAGIAAQGERVVVAVDRFCKFNKPHESVLMRFDTQGALDNSFGQGGMATVAGEAPYAAPVSPLLALPRGRLALGASTFKGGEVQVVGLLENGRPDPRFGRKGIASTRVASDSGSIHGLDVLLRDKNGNLSLTGSTDSGPFIVRFNHSGWPADFWTGSPWVSSLKGSSNFESFGGAFGVVASISFAQPDFGQFKNGELVVAGTILAQLRSNGVLKASYPPQPLPGAGRLRNADLLVARDGTVLVTLLDYHVREGSFTAYIARYR